MKFTVLREELQKAVSTTGRLATTRATLPILQNILLTVSSDGIELRSTDLEQTLQVKLEGKDLEVGSLTVPAKLITDYLQNNPDEVVTLSSDDTTLIVKSKNSSTKIKGMAAEEYPTIPSIKPDNDVILDFLPLSAAINKTLFASATDETRPILTGLLFRFSDKRLILVGTDGYRLAKAVIGIKSQLTADYVIPRRTLQELIRLSSEKEIRLAFAGTQMQIITDGTVLTSRLIEGNFPTFENIIPKKENFDIKLNAGLLNQNLKLASLFSRDSAFSTRLEIEGKKLVVTAISPLVGETKNEILLEEEGAEKFSVSINAQYLIDALTVIGGDIKIGFIDQDSPVVVKPLKGEDYLYLVMPLRSE